MLLSAWGVDARSANVYNTCLFFIAGTSAGFLALVPELQELFKRGARLDSHVISAYQHVQCEIRGLVLLPPPSSATVPAKCR